MKGILDAILKAKISEIFHISNSFNRKTEYHIHGLYKFPKKIRKLKSGN